MICRRCGINVTPIKVEQGVFNNVYRCPECNRRFGGSTIFKKGLKVSGYLLSLGLLIDGSDGNLIDGSDGDFDSSNIDYYDSDES